MQILEDKNKGIVIIGDINIIKDNFKENFKMFEENVRDMESVGKEWITIEDNTFKDKFKESFKIFEENVRDMESVGKEWMTIENNTCGLNYFDEHCFS